MSDLDDEGEPATEVSSATSAEPSVEDDLARIEGVAAELEAVEAELTVMDQARDARPGVEDQGRTT